MGYRDRWLNHAGAVSVHNEATLHAIDRTIPVRPMAMLLAGIGNGGAVEVWREVLPEGSTVIALDSDPRCADVPGIDPIICDVTQRDAVRGALKGRWLDVVIDTTRTMQPYLWPFLRAGGVYIYEGYNVEMVMMLARDLALEGDSWLPTEEIMRIDQYQSCVVIEKRNPRVVPYLQIMTGNFCEVTPEKVYQERGAKRVIPA
jgi:hypothetical protein